MNQKPNNETENRNKSYWTKIQQKSPYSMVNQGGIAENE